MRDDRAEVVCHCSHDDGPIDAVPLINSMAILPEPWEYVANGGGETA